MNRRNILKRSVAAFAALSTTSLPFLPLAAAQGESQRRRQSLKSLEADLQGTLLLPADPRYRAAAISANARFNQVLPLAIAMCKSPADVARCITWARNEGVPLSPGEGLRDARGEGRKTAVSVSNPVVETRRLESRRRTRWKFIPR